MELQAEHSKHLKYTTLGSKHHFILVAIETSGVFGHEVRAFIKELGHRLEQITADSKSQQHLVQQISVAIQRGNAAAVAGCMGSGVPLKELS